MHPHSRVGGGGTTLLNGANFKHSQPITALCLSKNNRITLGLPVRVTKMISTPLGCVVADIVRIAPRYMMINPTLLAPLIT